MKRSNIIQATFFLIFIIGIFSLINEELVQFNEAAKIDVVYVAPFVIIAISFWNLRLWHTSKLRFLRETTAILCLCLITAFLYILILNRILPAFGEFDVTGEIFKIKPGRGTEDHRLREMTVLLDSGEIVHFSLMHRRYLSVTSGRRISFKAKIGGLGLLYLE
jgi:hypothetical protein